MINRIGTNGQCSGIKLKLNCSSRNFGEVPLLSPIRQFNDIEELDLSKNRIRELYNHSFQNYPSIQVLNLNRNFIFSIEPHTFESLSELKDLDLSTNVLQEIPPLLPASLHQLRLDENPKIFEGNMGCVKGLHKLTSLEILSLRSNKMKGFPRFCNNQPNLMELDIYDNSFTTLSPLDLAPLCGLKRLNISPQKFEKANRFCECVAFEQWTDHHNISVNGPICKSSGFLKINCSTEPAVSAATIYNNCLEENESRKIYGIFVIGGSTILILGTLIIFIFYVIRCRWKRKLHPKIKRSTTVSEVMVIYENNRFEDVQINQ